MFLYKRTPRLYLFDEPPSSLLKRKFRVPVLVYFSKYTHSKLMLQDSVIMHKYRNRRHAVNLFAFLAIVFFAVITFKSHVIQYSKKIICTQDQSMVAAEQSKAS